MSGIVAPPSVTPPYTITATATGADGAAINIPQGTIPVPLTAPHPVFSINLNGLGVVTFNAVLPAHTQPTNTASSCVATPSSNSTTSPSSRLPSPSSAPATTSNCAGNGSSGLSSSSAVGLAFGCLIAGALLALAIGFFCLRRREAFAKKSTFQKRPISRSQSGHGVIPLAKPPSNSLAHVLEKLPAPVTHTQFEKEASQWHTNIKNYLANHADLAVDLGVARGQTLLASEQLSTLAGHDAPWNRLLRDKTTRYNAMRMLIARIVANRVDPEAAAEVSLLPQSVLVAYQDIVAGEKQNSDVLHMQNIWRTVTMNLISTTYQMSTATSLATSTSVQTTAKAIQDALSPLLLRNSESSTENEAHPLVDVVAKGTLLGLRMFEQSNPTKFFWKAEEEMRDRSSREPLVVFPGIRQRRMQPGSREPRHESVIVHPIRA